LGVTFSEQPTTSRLIAAVRATLYLFHMICLVEWVYVRGPNLARRTHPGS
jgi:hypothetical protein